MANALAAAGLARTFDIAPGAIRNGLRQFAPDHHRIEKIAERDGISWVNDSKATNPHATSAAFAAFEKVIWVAGGLAKGANMSKLIERRKGQIRAALLIGTDRELIRMALAEHAPDIPVVLVDEVEGLTGAERAKQLMRDVVLTAGKFAQPGDTVLLAPACASMDQFQSYAQRGEFFSDAVRELVGE